MIIVGVFIFVILLLWWLTRLANVHAKRMYPDILVIDVQQLELPSNDQGLMNQILISNN